MKVLYTEVHMTSTKTGSVDMESMHKIRVWEKDWDKLNVCGSQDWPGSKVTQK
jgi:hypothetical protein